jgi:hypothetical protein
MGRTPNYRFDRMQREKSKAEKKAEKAAAKEAKRIAEGGAPDEAQADKPATDSPTGE